MQKKCAFFLHNSHIYVTFAPARGIRALCKTYLESAFSLYSNSVKLDTLQSNIGIMRKDAHLVCIRSLLRYTFRWGR